MPRRIALALGLGLALSSPQSAHALGGSIGGITVDSGERWASVGEVTATYDRCAVEQAPPCRWVARLDLWPPSPTGCAQSGLVMPGPNHPLARVVWAHSANADGAVHGGPIAIPLDDLDDRILCLYIDRAIDDGSGSATPRSDLVASAVLREGLRAEALPTHPPALGFAQATRRLRAALARRFASWRSGTGRKARCRKRLRPAAIRCLGIRWRAGQTRFTGRAVVWRAGERLRLAYRVVALDLTCIWSAHSLRSGVCRTVRRG